MDITNNGYVLFHPNYIASKREQIRLQKLIKLHSDEIKNHLFKPNNNLKVWRVENKIIKKYVPQESRYNLKQIIKNFKLNREQFLHGYSNKYIDLFTNLLNDKNVKKYSTKRLSLADFRKKILKKKLNMSFEEFIAKEPLPEKYNFSKKNISNLYLTTVIQKLENKKQKNNFLTYKNEKEKSESNSKKHGNLLKDLFTEPNSNENNLKLKLNIEKNNNKLVKIFSYNDSDKMNFRNKEKSFNNNLYTSKECNTSFSESNIHFNVNNTEDKIISYRKDDDEEYKYFGKLTPKEEFIFKRNKAKYIDYLKNKYNFYTSNKIKDLKNYSEIKKRQILYHSNKNKVEYGLNFPYKKEFFKRYNRIKNKNNMKLVINDNSKSNEFHSRNSFPKRKKY